MHGARTELFAGIASAEQEHVIPRCGSDGELVPEPPRRGAFSDDPMGIRGSEGKRELNRVAPERHRASLPRDQEDQGALQRERVARSDDGRRDACAIHGDRGGDGPGNALGG